MTSRSPEQGALTDGQVVSRDGEGLEAMPDTAMVVDHVGTELDGYSAEESALHLEPEV